jgi:O-methyltransferase involved in polyketide biosynthesis
VNRPAYNKHDRETCATGYYSRYAAIRHLLHTFLSVAGSAGAGVPSQVLSLGAGFDTTWFQLMAESKAPTRYAELDFPEASALLPRCHSTARRSCGQRRAIGTAGD